MRKQLYGTTSLTGAALLASAGMIQTSEPLSMDVGGYFHTWLGIVDTDHCKGKPARRRPGAQRGLPRRPHASGGRGILQHEGSP